MLKKILISFLAVFFFLTAAGSRGEAFVPQTPHLLHLMVSKIKEPAGMVVRQVRRIPPQESEQSEIPAPGPPPASLHETLTYLFPGKLRAETTSGASRFYILADEAAVRVEDGRVVSRTLSPFDHYTDVLLFRDHDRLPLRLEASGVNTGKVTFQRLEGRVCFFIGDPPRDKAENPGLWIDKESFFPVRYLMKKGQWMVDVRYEDWQRISRTWYPMAVRIFVDGAAFAEITVSSAELGSGFSPDLFDVNRTLQTLPHASQADRTGSGHEDRVKALDKALEEFNRLYD